jgi:propanediol dehydratase small subunit
MSAKLRYPLGQYHRQRIRTATGTALEDLTLQSILDGRVGAPELRIHAETLRMQAIVARQAGYLQLAENLTRAAELVDMPTDEILEVYAALRPGRSTPTELVELADRLERAYSASRLADLVRDAAEAYRERGLLRGEG